MAVKEKKPVFIVEFPLITKAKYQEDVLAKRLEIARTIYNRLVRYYNALWVEMTRTKRYRAIKDELKEIRATKASSGNSLSKPAPKKTEREKELYSQLSSMYKEYGFTDFGMQAKALEVGRPYNCHVGSTLNQAIAKRLWRAWNAFLFKDGRKIHFSKYGEFNSIEGKTNKTGIRFKENYVCPHLWKGEKPAILWNDLVVEVGINYKNPYEVQALTNEIAYNRIIRKRVKGKDRYYVQIVFRGTPPLKIDKETGEIKHPMGKGTVGVDMGMKLVGAVSKDKIIFQELADKVQNIESKIARLNRALDRSRRATNPDNYNEDGTIKKQGNKKLIWHKSNRYKKLQLELKELHRKQATIRKLQHYITVNELIEMGDLFYVEKLDYKDLQKRKTQDEKTAVGTPKSKTRCGKQIANTAPSMLVDMLTRKAEQLGGCVIKVDTKKIKASQYNHITDEYKKKPNHQRWDTIADCQKNLYAAFLLMNIDDQTETIDKKKCEETFADFKGLHDELIQNLKESEKKYPWSMGIR